MGVAAKVIPLPGSFMRWGKRVIVEFFPYLKDQLPLLVPVAFPGREAGDLKGMGTQNPKAMTVVEPGKRASFMVACRTNYFNDIHPADPEAQKAGGYREAVSIAQMYFKDGRVEAFRAYLAETRYLADLWAAHLLLEHGAPGASVQEECLGVIGRYAAATFDAALARQEQLWLEQYTATGQKA